VEVAAADAMRSYSFPPVIGPGARVLVLGSMPGQASLAAGRYYAHPRNTFWPIVSGALAGGKELSYRQGLALLKKNHVALWDVLHSCVRSGSADTAIKREEPNNIGGLLIKGKIRLVIFNGAKAEQCFKRHILPGLPPACAGIQYLRLPSTSPAHAAMNFERKLALWKKALDGGK